MPSKPITIQGRGKCAASKSWTRVFSQDWESEIGTISQKHTCSRMHIFWTIKRWKLWSEINVEMIFENRFLHSAKGESSEGPIQEITVGSWLKVPLFGDLLLRGIRATKLSTQNFGLYLSAKHPFTVISLQTKWNLWKHIGAYCLYLFIVNSIYE